MLAHAAPRIGKVPHPIFGMRTPPATTNSVTLPLHNEPARTFRSGCRSKTASIVIAQTCSHDTVFAQSPFFRARRILQRKEVDEGGKGFPLPALADGAGRGTTKRKAFAIKRSQK